MQKVLLLVLDQKLMAQKHTAFTKEKQASYLTVVRFIAIKLRHKMPFNATTWFVVAPLWPGTSMKSQ